LRVPHTARPKKADPKYRYHVSGQAVVTLDGKDFYLGKHDTPESRSRYHKLLAEYQQNGLKAPDQPQRQVNQPITVADVTAKFRESASRKYANNREEQRWYVARCEMLESHHGDLPAKDFGPRKLTALLGDAFVESGNSRLTVNRKAD
jgi:hypothetical protein